MNRRPSTPSPRSSQNLLVLLLCGLSVLGVDRCLQAAGRAPQAAAPAASPKSPERALLDQYCVACHNQRTKTAGIAFDTLDVAHVSADADIWE